VNPPILVLDDATSAVDVQVEQEIHGGPQDADAGAHDADRGSPPPTIGLADRVVLLRRPHRPPTGRTRAAQSIPLCTWRYISPAGR